MMKTNIRAFISWGLLAVYTFFFYHLLFIPFLLEFSLLGALLGWGSLIGIIFIIPKEQRKPIVLFIILTILSSTALYRSGGSGTFFNIKIIFFYIVILSTIYVTAVYYGKLPKVATISLLFITLIIHFTIPRDELKLYNYFIKKWESPILYTGDTVDYFPLFVHDVDGDGQEEIITFGNIEEQKEIYLERKRKGIPPDRMPYDIDEERLFLYVYKWNGSEMERVDNNTLDLEKIRTSIPKDYIGFPYYYWDENFTLIPQIQKQTLAEVTTPFGTSPFLAFHLDLLTLNKYLDEFDGVYSMKNDFRFETDIEYLSIEKGNLTVVKSGKSYTQQTNATKIIDLVRTHQGIGILLLGEQLELWKFDNTLTTLTLTHVINEEQIKNIMSSRFIVGDIQSDGLDEILISSPTKKATIVRPEENGKWEILFVTNNTLFEDFAPIGEDKNSTIVALSQNRFGGNQLRYLTGYTYTEKGLKQNWKTFISPLNVQSADITGSGKNHLVASIWKSHKFFILDKHGLPVIPLLLVVFISLIAYSIYWRVRNHA